MKRIAKFLYATISLIAITISCTKEPSQPTVAVTGVTLSFESTGLDIGEQKALTATVFPSDATNKNVSFSSSKESVATVSQDGIVEARSTGKAIVTVTTEDGKFKAHCTVNVLEILESLELVDLGLSVKWRKWNLGASKPEEYGGYYQWAGLEDVTKFYSVEWSNCPYHAGYVSARNWTKYIPSDESLYWSGPGSPDNKTVLDPEDDVAHVKLGGKWRMPTMKEWEELLFTCSWTKTSINGIEGYKIQPMKSGYTDKWIFLPAAGMRKYGQYPNNSYLCCYWSSSLYLNDPNRAYCILSKTDGGCERYCGLSVRPVSE